LSEYITCKFTDDYIISKSIASTTGMFNIHTLDWDDDILEIIGISKDSLSPTCNITHQVKIKPEICTELGLEIGTKLIIGAGDGLMSHIGSGCISNNIMSSTIGTSSAIRIISDEPILSAQSNWCYYFMDNYIAGYAINAGWNTIHWFIDNFTKNNHAEILQNFYQNFTVTRNTDLIFLPFINGERGPGYNQNMFASFIGLHSKDNFHTMLNAVMEGIIYNLYSCYEMLESFYDQNMKIYASGGYINSDFLLQMQSDVFNREIIVPNIQQGGAYGAVLTSLVSLGIINSIYSYQSEEYRKFKPDIITHKKYMSKYSTYKNFYSFFSSKKE